MKHQRILFITLTAAAILLLAGSCVPHKRIIYLQDKSETATSDTIQHQKTEYRIKSYDNLYIKVMSMDENTYSFFNTTQGQNQNIYTAQGIYYNSYHVDKEGDIMFPFIGKIDVKELTIKEAENIIQGKVDEYLKDATVIVKLVNFNITVLGEVNKPGKFEIYQDDINIFQALGMAGDINSFGNRDKIKIVRKTANGSIIKVIDMTDKHSIHDEFYWLMPNDIVYVERLKGKSFVQEAFPYSLIFSTITTTLLIINYLN